MDSIKNISTYYFWNVASYFDYHKCDEIIDNIWVGNIASANDRSFDVIVNASTDIPFYQLKDNRKIIVEDNCRERDFLNMDTQLEEIVDFIHEKVRRSKKILVHCRVGAQRSCTIVAAYLMKYRDFKLKESVEYIKARRANAFNDYNHFEIVLQRFYISMINYRNNKVTLD